LLGDAVGPDTIFCGAPKDGARSYCAHHGLTAYQPATKVASAERKAAWLAKKFK
jgi:hypothetical protein